MSEKNMKYFTSHAWICKERQENRLINDPNESPNVNVIQNCGAVKGETNKQKRLLKGTNPLESLRSQFHFYTNKMISSSNFCASVECRCKTLRIMINERRKTS